MIRGDKLDWLFLLAWVTIIGSIVYAFGRGAGAW